MSSNYTTFPIDRKKEIFLMKDFLSTQEFSKLSGIATSTLRYWDDIGLFSPRKRNPENNCRYYTPDQMIAVKFITVLSDLKIPLKIISDAEKNGPLIF